MAVNSFKLSIHEERIQKNLIDRFVINQFTPRSDNLTSPSSVTGTSPSHTGNFYFLYENEDEN